MSHLHDVDAYTSLDRQTYDDIRRQDFDPPPDFEHYVVLTDKQLSEVTRALEAVELMKALIERGTHCTETAADLAEIERTLKLKRKPQA